MVDFEAFNKMKSNKIILAMAFVLLLSVQLTSAYEVRSALPGLNLWDLFVEYTFGNFFLAVVVIGLLFAMILIFGGISPLTTIVFGLTYLSAMAIGYGMPLISVSVFAGAIIFFIYQLTRLAFDGT